MVRPRPDRRVRDMGRAGSVTGFALHVSVGPHLCRCRGSAFLLPPGHVTPDALPIERTVHDRYRLEQVLGRGGVAVVYLATDLTLNRGVAVKVLARTVLDDVHAPRRFEREAKLLASLQHRNIAVLHGRFSSLR